MPTRQKHWLGNWRVWLALSCVPVMTTLTLWIAASFFATTVSFQIAPYSYDIAVYNNAVTIQQTLNAVRNRWLGYRSESAHPFEPDFYDGWHRADKMAVPWPLVGYHIRYALGPETAQINPDFAVTPSKLIVIGFKQLFPICAGIPLGGIACVSLRRVRLQPT